MILTEKKLCRFFCVQLFVNGYPALTNVSLNNGLWHHLCVTWDGRTGDWHLYVNGSVRAAGHQLAGGTYIQGGGVLVLGKMNLMDSRLVNAIIQLKYVFIPWAWHVH